MEPIKDALLETLADIKPRATKIPYISTVTGGICPGEDLDARFWWPEMFGETVLFSPALNSLIRAGRRFIPRTRPPSRPPEPNYGVYVRAGFEKESIFLV